MLLPAAEDESQGVEDARFVRFTDDDGVVDYRATYTAYDGSRIGNRLLVSPDLQTFTSTPLSGPGARNKGMALFPRRVGGRFMALSRADGMTIGVTTAEHGYVWGDPVNIEGPSSPWQILQVGNASPPMETPHGWLVVTHGVGLMRTYSLGAILLDLDDPTTVLAKLERPLLLARRARRLRAQRRVLLRCDHPRRAAVHSLRDRRCRDLGGIDGRRGTHRRDDPPGLAEEPLVGREVLLHHPCHPEACDCPFPDRRAIEPGGQ